MYFSMASSESVIAWSSRSSDWIRGIAMWREQADLIVTKAGGMTLAEAIDAKSLAAGDTLFKGSVGGVRAPGSTSYDDTVGSDVVVITAGVPFGTPGSTNVLRIAWIEPGLGRCWGACCCGQATPCGSRTPATSWLARGWRWPAGPDPSCAGPPPR